MYDAIVSADQLEQPQDAGAGVKGELKRWMMELDLSGKVEKKWREKGHKALERYRDEGERADRKFNIYWANVETLRPTLYATLPKLDVRRRFRDADPVGKLAAEVMERALDYSIDSYDFDEEIDNIMLDYLIPSRGVARVRFEPTIETKPLPQEVQTESQPSEAAPSTYQELTYAHCYIEHVPWDRFRRGPGITWKEVPWVAYQHQLTRDEVEKQFPGYGSKVEYDIIMEGVEKDKADSEPSVFKRVMIWEVWDKSTKKVRFLAPSYSDDYLKVEDDKLNLEGFFDCERPLYAVKTSNTLVPQVEFEMYRDQAKELDRVTMRISRLVSTLKQRGIYDSTVTEFKELLKAADNEMIPTSTSGAAMAMGGLDKAIYMLPIDKAAAVLKELIAYRDQVKQTIYEITGMSDILRGATDPNETLGAQQLKAQTGSKRIQRRQRDVQRFIRGLLRKKAEIIAENYTPQLLALMTGIQLPFAADKAAAQQQLQQLQAQQQMQQGAQGQQPQGQPQPPAQPAAQPQIPPQIQQLLASPTWEDVMGVIKNDMLRSFRIDIETDSTIAADQEADREQVTEMIKGIGGFVESIGPAIQEGAISMDTAKKILLAAVRRFKFGREVEDAIDQDSGQPMQQRPDPEMSKVQAQMELEKFKAQTQMQLAQATQQAQAQQDTLAQQQEAERDRQKLQLEHDAEIQKMLLDHKFDMEELAAQNAAKIQQIEANKQSDMVKAEHSAALAQKPAVVMQVDGKDEIGKMAATHAHVMEGISQAVPMLAQAAHTIGQAVTAHQQQAAAHGEMLRQMAEHTAASNGAVVDAVKQLAAVHAAPRKAIRDPKTKQIVGSEIVMPQQ